MISYRDRRVTKKDVTLCQAVSIWTFNSTKAVTPVSTLRSPVGGLSQVGQKDEAQKMVKSTHP